MLLPASGEKEKQTETLAVGPPGLELAFRLRLGKKNHFS
jgi:hypothetical protein